MYTKESLKVINQEFINKHYCILDDDVRKANEYVQLIEQSRSTTTPKIGDILIYTNKYGEYYPHAHIERVNDYDECGGNVCEHPYVPFVRPNENNDGITCSTSGGAWSTVDPSKMKYVGKKKKMFKDWGHCGACAHGAINFEAEVSVWEYSETDSPYTTKDYNKGYLTFGKGKKDSRYNYFLSSYGRTSIGAWTTDLEMQAWLRTHRVVHVEKGAWENQYVIWYWKEQTHSNLSPEEYDALDLPEDVIQMNGHRRCKRRYDEINHIIHTYYVWYWDEKNEDEHYSERYARQNEIRKARYELDWHGATVNEYAMKELKDGKVEPIKFE